MRGLFIAVEGGEGAGKSTLIEALRQFLESKGERVLIAREPGGTTLGNQIRELLLNGKSSISPQAELLLFLASRAQQLEEVILPALKRGVILLCDRFYASTVAYQGAGRGLGTAYVEELCHLASHGAMPDHTFLVDIDPDIGLARSKATRELDRIEMETLEFHKRVRQAFIQLASRSPHRYTVIDGSLSAADVFLEATAALCSVLSRR